MKLRSNYFKFIIGFAISLGALILCFITIDIEEVKNIIFEVNYLYIIPAIILCFACLFVRALRLKYIFNNTDNISLQNIYNVLLIGCMANNLLPLRIGEIVKCIYICKKSNNIRFYTIISVSFIEKIYEISILLLLGLIAIVIVVWDSIFINSNSSYYHFFIFSIILISVIFTIFLIAVILFITSYNKVINFILKIILIISKKYFNRINNIIINLTSDIEKLCLFKKIVNIFIISIIAWILEIFTYVVVAYSFHIDVYITSFITLFVIITIVMVMANLFGAIPSFAGGIGVFEIVAQQTLVIFGIDKNLAISYSLVLHILVLILPINIIGLFLLSMDNLKYFYQRVICTKYRFHLKSILKRRHHNG